MRNPSFKRLVSCVGCIVFMSGCGKPAVPTIPVTGRVTFENGACPAAGTVVFTPISVVEGLPRRPGLGAFGEDGKFQVTTFQPNDGLIPGKYQVKLECWKTPPDELTAGVSHVPAKFSPPEVTIEEKNGEPASVVIDVPRG